MTVECEEAAQRFNESIARRRTDAARRIYGIRGSAAEATDPGPSEVCIPRIYPSSWHTVISQCPLYCLFIRSVSQLPLSWYCPIGVQPASGPGGEPAAATRLQQ
jgi:hypothetical protein